MHELRTHFGLKALDKFPKGDYMNVEGLFDVCGSTAQSFDALADFARVWAMTTGTRKHFCPRQVFLHFGSKITVDAINKSKAEACGGMKPYVIGAN